MNITPEMSDACRNLSKTGTLSFDEEYLRTLSASLSAAEAGELHSYFREQSQRSESEWRGEFLALFPQAVDVLLPIDEAEFWQDRLFTLVRAGDLEGVQNFVAEIGTAAQEFDPERTYAECARMGSRQSLLDVPFDFYPVEGGNEDGTTAVSLARNLGHDNIAAFLEAIIATLDARYLAAYLAGKALT